MDKNAWHLWRNKGLGSSDAPIIMGVSPWMTPYQLWEIKCGLTTKPRGNWATDRGNEMEPRARARYELEHDVEMPAQLVEHAEYPWLRASLDGYNRELRRVLEIKCPGAADHETARGGKVPEKYWPQVQHQLLVTGAEAVHYYSFDGNEGVTVVVEPDMTYIARLFEALGAFWSAVQTKTPPALTDRDLVKVREPTLLALAELWANAKRRLAEAEAAEAQARRDMLAAIEARGSAHPRLVMGSVKAVRSVRKGSVDYAAMPQLASLRSEELEQYRKPPTVVWSFKEE